MSFLRLLCRQVVESFLLRSPRQSEVPSLSLSRNSERVSSPTHRYCDTRRVRWSKSFAIFSEYERRATTPKRIPRRLASYRRYFASGWAERDHGGSTPGVLFVFETPESGTAFLDVADATEGLGMLTANAEALGERGILGEAWILPPPHSLDRAPLAALY